MCIRDRYNECTVKETSLDTRYERGDCADALSMFGRFSIAHFGFTCQAQLLLRVHRKEIRPLYYIDEVKKSRGYDGYDVIISLAYTQNLNTKASMWCTKRQMIDYINAHPFPL